MSRKYKFIDQSSLYFISTATVFWVDVFTREEYSNILMEGLSFCVKEKDLDIYAYCLMTNHFHAIIGTRGRPMDKILRELKQFTAKRILSTIENNPFESRKKWMLRLFEWSGKRTAGNERYQFWQHDNHPVWLNSYDVIMQKLDYIHQNPVRAGFVDRPEDWRYSSAKNYYTKEQTVIDVILLE